MGGGRGGWNQLQYNGNKKGVFIFTFFYALGIVPGWLVLNGRCLKGQCHDFSTSGFFHKSVSPKLLSVPLGPFRFFSEIRGDIRSSRFTTGVVDTGGKWKKSSIRKILIILLGHLWIVEYINFCLQVHFKVSAA